MHVHNKQLQILRKHFDPDNFVLAWHVNYLSCTSTLSEIIVFRLFFYSFVHYLFRYRRMFKGGHSCLMGNGLENPVVASAITLMGNVHLIET